MRATLVNDIRLSQHVPGAVEFDSTAKLLFWVCPCGCGTICWVNFLRSYSTRDPLGIYALEFDDGGKPSKGEPLVVGTDHWQGTLINDEWMER